jgi:hypothetical protein
LITEIEFDGCVRTANWNVQTEFNVDNARWSEDCRRARWPSRRDVGRKSLLGYAGSLGSPNTAYLYDWNILPIGQLLWEEELMSHKEFPPMQAPETYNLDGTLQEMKKAGHQSE